MRWLPFALLLLASPLIAEPPPPTGGGATDEIADADGDTKIEVERTADDDILWFSSLGEDLGKAFCDGTNCTTTLYADPDSQAAAIFAVEEPGGEKLSLNHDGTKAIITNTSGDWHFVHPAGAEIKIFPPTNHNPALRLQNGSSDSSYTFLRNDTTTDFYAISQNMDIASTGTQIELRVGSGTEITVTDDAVSIDALFAIEPEATAPGTCVIKHVYIDTSGAFCVCTSANTWTNTTGVGSCA